jgi:hypothetical protein
MYHGIFNRCNPSVKCSCPPKTPPWVAAGATSAWAWNLSHPGILKPITPHLTLHSTRVFLEDAKHTPLTIPAQGNENCLFVQGQVCESHLLAPFAWEGSIMKSTSAHQAHYGVVRRLIPGEMNRDTSSTLVEPLSVPTGNALSVALTLELATIMSVLDVGKRIMEPKTVLEHRRNRALTPYHHEVWCCMLTEHCLLEKYSSIPHSLQFGFDAGICLVISTFTPDNSPTLYVHTKQYQEIMDHEFSCGRYIGPFSKVEVEELLSPFQSLPLSLIPKPGNADKYRAVHNFYFPHSPQDNISSINYSINSNLFPCTWGIFVMLCAIIWHCPEGSQASICDVTEVYCTIPILLAQWPGLVIKLCEPDQFTINTNDNFGLTLAGGIHGSVADAGTDLFHAMGISPLLKWVDDHIFF